MKKYSTDFKEYLKDLSRKKPSPGGGSTVCLIFCSGVSLIEKAINYSFIANSQLKVGSGKGGNIKLKKCLDNLYNLRKKIYPYIDKDGYFFEKIIQTKGKKRTEFIKKSEKLVIDVADSCQKVFFLAKGIESDIKSSIISDFYIGLDFVKSALSGCILNLEANRKIFGSNSNCLNLLKKNLKLWEKS